VFEYGGHPEAERVIDLITKWLGLTLATSLVTTAEVSVGPIIRYDQSTGVSTIVGFWATSGGEVKTKIGYGRSDQWCGVACSQCMFWMTSWSSSSRSRPPLGLARSPNTTSRSFAPL